MTLIKPEMLTSSQETLNALETEVHSELANEQEITCTDNNNYSLECSRATTH